MKEIAPPKDGPREPTEFKTPPVVQQISGGTPSPYDEAIRRLKSQYPQYAEIPDDELAAKIAAKYPQYRAVLTKPVPEPTFAERAAKAPFGQSPNPFGIPSPSLGMALPPGASMLGRTALQGLTAGLESLLAGKGGKEAAKDTGRGAAFNVGAEGLMKGVVGPLARGVARQFSAPAAIKAGADAAATNVADDLIKNVPALKGTEVSGKGLYDAIYGAGREKVSAAFDEAMKAVAASAKGKTVQIPWEAAERLGIQGTGGSQFLRGMSPAIREQLERQGKLAASGMVTVDAAELAGKATGFWSKGGKGSQEAYRAAVNALDSAGLGDPAARSAYKTWAGYSDFIDKAKALDANGVLDQSKLMKAFADMKKVDILRRRGLGSGTEGPLQAAARTRPDVVSHKIPEWYRHMLGSGIGGGIGHLLGGPMGALGGAIGGFLGGRVIPGQFVTKGPVPETLSRGIPGLTGPLAVGARSLSDRLRQPESEE